jgi:hypothetical protein
MVTGNEERHVCFNTSSLDVVNTIVAVHIYGEITANTNFTLNRPE